MRYLNKIIFLNSADKSLPYAEVSLDGNTHFIGTQGVGKSTLLRAILFFYNANKQKLGIPREKKTFDEYYFPYPNSYIVYEVKTEIGAFCVLALKSQGRVIFRFFDSEYKQSYFVDNDGNVFETWDKIRDNLGRINSTKKIDSYEDYRNILYGNNKGLSNEFRKYALLESRQYQNIPSTITNVFLNTKLDAEFVKETIIKSLNEDEIKIDLETYKSHLRDFETELNDIQIWANKNRSGESIVEKQAENVSKFYSSLKYLEKNKEELATQLGWALNHIKEKQPIVQELLRIEELKKKNSEEKFKDLDKTFEKKRDEIQKQIGIFSEKLKTLKSKQEEYDILNIVEIIKRVSKKDTLDMEKSNLNKEKEILTSEFIEIQQRYDALLKQFENQFKEFENSKHKEINTAKSNFVDFKDEISRQFESIFENIRTQHKAELELAQTFVKEIENSINLQKINNAEVKNKRFYEKEIKNCQIEISDLKTKIINADNAINQAKKEQKNLEKEWQLEETGIKTENERKVEKETEKQLKLKSQIADIDFKVENSKDSLYGWLNAEIPDWQNTIGQVIDDKVLFQQGLNPQKTIEDARNFYGISIDLQEIDKEVKTISDYEQDKSIINEQITEILKSISALNAQTEKELENLKTRFHKKIKEQKDKVSESEYIKNQSDNKIQAKSVELTEWESKAKTEKDKALKNIDNEINRLSDEKIKGEGKVEIVKQNIDKQLKVKQKEKEAKIKSEEAKLTRLSEEINVQIKDFQAEITRKTEETKQQQKNELSTKGANTKRISEIDLQITEIDKELSFIESNRDKVAEYNKDKRELFDHEAEFKNQKSKNDNLLKTEKQKYDQQKSKLIQEIGIHNAEIETINKTLTAILEDFKAFETFKNSEVFPSLENCVNSYADHHKTEIRVLEIINQINNAHYQSKDRLTDLQEAVNKFVGNFQEKNLFSFKTKFISRNDYFEFADNLKEFIENDKITEYKKRVEERFAHIIQRIGKETNELISREGEISQVVSEINKDFEVRNFVGAIKKMELRTEKSSNTIFQLLVEIKNFNTENTFELGSPNLFSTIGQENKNEKAISYLRQLSKEMVSSGLKQVLLSDSFELQFKIVENDNDTGWVEKLTNVGSEGTDTLVKAMINIMLLNVFKERSTRKSKIDFSLHCMMDEIGKLHPNNVKGILKFANDRNILLINSSPTSYNASDYKYTYILLKDSKNKTTVKRLVAKK
ncbi:MAG: ATP-binding protein [Paludibacter sp.]|nr:ATP-binding protein [Paludibacter sp.]